MRSRYWDLEFRGGFEKFANKLIYGMERLIAELCRRTLLARKRFALVNMIANDLFIFLMGNVR